MIAILMGVSGSGKTTVGRVLAERLGCPFSDADDFHSAANKAKMAAGQPLTDSDREPWLHALRVAIDGWKQAGDDHVLACSALKRRYRAMLGGTTSDQRFFYLKGDYALIEARLRSRTGHFFDPALLRSQFDALEEPTDAVIIDLAQPVETQVGEILRVLEC